MLLFKWGTDSSSSPNPFLNTTTSIHSAPNLSICLNFSLPLTSTFSHQALSVPLLICRSIHVTPQPLPWCQHLSPELCSRPLSALPHPGHLAHCSQRKNSKTHSFFLIPASSSGPATVSIPCLWTECYLPSPCLKSLWV